MTHCTHSSTQGLATDGQWHGEGPAPAAGQVLCRDCGEYIADPFHCDAECLEHGPECRGTVEYRMPLSGTGRAFPRCDHHWSLRLDAQERINRDYPDSPVAPGWFDPTYAGESWDESY